MRSFLLVVITVFICVAGVAVVDADDGAKLCASVVVTAAIPTDTPSAGTIRIERDSGNYTLHPYSTFTGSTFTITSHDFTSDPATQPKSVFISYIDKLAAGASEAFTVVYLSDRTVFVRVRDGGGTPIKTFETTGTIGTAGGSSTAIRTPDA